MNKKNKKKKNLKDSPAYQDLLSEITKIVDDAKAKGVDFGERDDLLTCRACGAYEDCAVKEGWVICDEDGNILKQERFIIIDSRSRSYHRNKTTYFKNTYMFICTKCGAQQEEIVRNRYEDD
ncbi:MAG: hypothetical protein A2Y03_09635 [Omnitrophica WOR_2 bacterium GWF2_38_59]|nr:MAG: hypothetical protein A2Y03_09635 [Omnitrophica WOR_2 bacterium GWF2_38_59]OGX47553.1 MAG: hypothetical protein A2243_04620 [Omnitrophica WOR_2 bacterium RIFOXYA2_FULL_38_17]OGX58666.1 MAG: hypothetical protein A2306_10460 [Omnitrophica WOR_2 bacterium RIFOXYB2_FULL_38_16]HBG61930.1 hypothetical protein [Candidatus Omnitrophota bacterium]